MSEEAMTVITQEAGEDLSASQYCFVEVDSDKQTSLAAAAGYASGVQQDKPDAAGKASAICIAGRTKVKLGATLSAGAKVTGDSSGRAVAATTGNYMHGYLTVGGNINEIGEMVFQPMGRSE